MLSISAAITWDSSRRGLKNLLTGCFVCTEAQQTRQPTERENIVWSLVVDEMKPGKTIVGKDQVKQKQKRKKKNKRRE